MDEQVEDRWDSHCGLVRGEQRDDDGNQEDEGDDGDTGRQITHYTESD